MRFLLIVTLLVYGSASAATQSLLTFTGGTVSGKGIEISWSLGEVVVATASDENVAATQGFQQPFDLEETDTTSVSNITVNVITPNGDGINEKFLIEDATNLPDNHLIIINRWREVVYEKEGYGNDWEGTTQDGRPLPQAAYYYFFYPNKKLREPPQRGTIHILRD